MTYEPSNDAGPVGSGDYLVQGGECVSSISFRHGHFWETVWDAPENQALRDARKTPFVLLAGDRLTIPPIRSKEESAATESTHRYRRRGVPETLRLAVHDAEGKPRADAPFTLDVDGKVTRGTTDSQGMVKAPIPPGANVGRLTVGEGDDQIVYELDLGGLDPVTETTGVQARLKNLRLYDGPVDGKLGAELRAALAEFQGAQALDPTGEIDQATRDKLVAVHGY